MRRRNTNYKPRFIYLLITVNLYSNYSNATQKQVKHSYITFIENIKEINVNIQYQFYYKQFRNQWLPSCNIHPCKF